MKYRILLRLLAVVATLCGTVLVSGCASTKEVRASAALLASYTSDVQKRAERLAETRNWIVKARLKVIRDLEVNAVEGKQNAQRFVEIWRMIDDKSRTNLYQSVHAATENTRTNYQALNDLRTGHDKLIAEGKSKVNIRSGKLAQAAIELARLSEEPDIGEQINFYVTFFQEVRNGIAELEESEQKQLEATKSQASESGQTEGP